MVLNFTQPALSKVLVSMGFNHHPLTLALLSFVTVIANHSVTNHATANDAATFEQLLDDAWEFEMRESPTFATQTGDNRFNDRLADVSLADHVRRLDERRKFKARLTEINRDALDVDQQLNYDIFAQLLYNEIGEAEHKGYLIPITSRSGFHVSFPTLAKNVPLNSVKDYENYIARLTAFDRHANQNIELMREGMRQQRVLPAVVLEGYRKSITTHIVDDAADSLLYVPFKKFPEAIPVAERARLKRVGGEAIMRHVVPGYQHFLEFMEKDYVPAASGSIAAAAMPGGREYYRFLVRKFTTLDVTPRQVHDIGLREVARIKAEMLAVIKKTGFEGDFAAFLEHLRTDPKFYAETPEQLMKEVAYVLKRMDGELPKLFNTLPRTPYGIQRIPDYIAPQTTTAYYQLPAGDGSRAGFYFVNTYDLKSRPLYEVEALSLHEAVPGHHLQLALQQELSDLPKFRRFASFTAFVEGWALYSERLGLEVGFYQDPYSDFGRLTYEMWRACRLVVDTGMHYLGWTRQQAIDFMARNSALSIHNIGAEVDRYISWPGQALGYKMGELKIRQLRLRAENKLGDRFDLREFHRVVLSSGSIPLPVLESNVDQYIESALAIDK